MPEAVKGQQGTQPPQVTHSGDGQRHLVENALTVFAFLAGIAAFAIGFIVRAHVVGTVLGIAGFVVGLYAQMVSATRVQRVFIMTGIIGSFVGMGLSIAHGGFG
jgi:hypothetical protein